MEADPGSDQETLDALTLSARARRLGQTASDAERLQLSTLWLAEFSLGGSTFALPLASLRAALPIQAVSPIPLAPPGLMGLVRHDGKLLSAWSLAALLGSQRWERDSVVVLVVELGRGRLAALDAEQVPRATAVPAEVMDQARPLPRPGLAEVVLEGRRSLTLIDPARLLPEGRGARGA